MTQTKQSISKLRLLFMIVMAIGLFTSCKKEVLFDKNLTQEFTILSAKSRASYKIQIGLPCAYNPATTKYETIYVLDAETDFSVVAAQCRKLAACSGVQNVIVVGIGYGNDRATDYTPTKTGNGNGGAQDFMEFIRTELIPKVESEYAVDTTRKSRAIIGHSFGGLLAGYAFTKHNEVFGNYIILSPSIWYDNEILLQYEQDTRPLNRNKQQLVFMGLGALENSGRMQAPFEAFYQRLKNNYSTTIIAGNFPSGLDHMGSKAPNIEAGLKFYFDHK